EPRWISGARSRAMVHRERARVDAVLTGMGTVMVDDPLLTVRGTRARRTPLRVVWAPRLGLPLDRAIVRTGRPWVIAKWAESADGRIATRPGEPRWISGARSRAMVHRERARVDAVLTGMGTVMVDAPLLTVRGTRARRTPLRVVWAPRLGMPHDRAIVRTAREVPTVVAASAEAIAGAAREADGLRAHGIDVLAAADEGALLAELGRRGVATVLVEAGSGLVRPMVARGLVNAAWVFTSPHELGDAGPRSAAPMTAAELSRLDCAWTGRRGDDRVSLYLVPA
ncbi:MAG: dihydrofolate reductase family protein, partial [Phycisphaerales bacterium]